ncbi:MAG: IS630 family transposase [Proteobacteria bacterium]|nr:IS630 family transposase [Pseudomonadota bacterium]
MSSMEQYGSEDLVYLDESGFNGKENFRYRCWSAIGQKIIDKIRGKRLKRESILVGLKNKKLIAPFIFDGTCDTDLFNYYLANELLPELPEKQVIIMDNARIHKSEKTKELIEDAGHVLLFLPPYSPDLNPIEKRFGSLKKFYSGMPIGSTLDELILCNL